MSILNVFGLLFDNFKIKGGCCNFVVFPDQIHNLNSYVRDYYCFKRSQYPQLELVYMKPEEAFNALQKQELLHKFIEIGKVLLTWAILKNVDMVRCYGNCILLLVRKN